MPSVSRGTSVSNGTHLTQYASVNKGASVSNGGSAPTPPANALTTDSGVVLTDDSGTNVLTKA